LNHYLRKTEPLIGKSETNYTKLLACDRACDFAVQFNGAMTRPFADYSVARTKKPERKARKNRQSKQLQRYSLGMF
jgi:hypothetical protein